MLFSSQECFKIGDHVLRVVVDDSRNSGCKIEGHLIQPNKPNLKIAAHGAYNFVLALNTLGDIGYKDHLPSTVSEIKAWMFDTFLS